MCFAQLLVGVDTALMDLGYVIRALREARSWTQEELADRASTTGATISRIEKGKQDTTSDVLRNLAAAFDLKVYQLVAMAENEVPTDLLALESPDEADLLQHYRRMTKHRASILLEVAACFAEEASF